MSINIKKRLKKVVTLTFKGYKFFVIIDKGAQRLRAIEILIE